MSTATGVDGTLNTQGPAATPLAPPPKLRRRPALVAAAIGVVLAVVVAVSSIFLRLKPTMVAVLFLAVLALGAPVTFGTGFALGMDVADAYAVGGESHTVWAGVLYMSSLAALVAIPLTFAGSWARRNRQQGRTALA